MATKKWIGGSQSVRQVTTISWSAYTSGQTYTVTCNGKTVNFVASASTAANVIAGIIAALGATGVETEFTEFTASDGTTNVTLTGATAGKPFVVTASATTGSATVTDTVDATGPNHFDEAKNWEGGSLPSAGDDLVFANSNYSVLYGLVDANNYASLTIDSTFTGTIGLPITTSSSYREYRARYLKLGDGSSSITLIVGQGTGPQSSRINLDFNAGTIVGRVYGAGVSTSADSELPLQIKNTDSSSTIVIHGGKVQLGADSSGSFASVKIIAQQGNRQCEVLGESTVALGAITMFGGSLEVRGSATSLVATNGAKFTIVGAATCPTVTVSQQASVIWASTAGITTLTVQNQGSCSFAGEASAKTVATAYCGYAGEIADPMGIITWTNGITLSGCKLSDTRIDLGTGVIVKRV